MLRVASYDVVFQEIPGEVTLALNLSLCPNQCPGCHSPHLWEAVGETLTPELLSGLLERYGAACTCVCLMGGDNDPAAVAQLLGAVRATGRWKTAWYSGCTELDPRVEPSVLDYLKLGPYVADLGGLDSPTTNQRLWKIGSDGSREDLTATFWK